MPEVVKDILESGDWAAILNVNMPRLRGPRTFTHKGREYTVTNRFPKEMLREKK